MSAWSRVCAGGMRSSTGLWPRGSLPSPSRKHADSSCGQGAGGVYTGHTESLPSDHPYHVPKCHISFLRPIPPSPGSGHQPPPVV